MKISIWLDEAPLAQGVTQEDRPQITPYVVHNEATTAAMIILPGGGYANRAAHEGEPIALWLNELGISAFVVDYRVAPYQYPAPLLDAQRSIRYVRHHAEDWNIDPQRIGILGFSAGGHLASTAGTHFDAGMPNADDPVERVSCRPDAMVLCYPVISFGEHGHDGSMDNLLGANAPADLRKYLSNELQVTDQTPPTFLWHTANDPVVKVENSLLFAAALSHHGVPFDLHIYEDGRHGLGLAQDEPETHTWTKVCEHWLGRRGFHSKLVIAKK
ncbi:MAG: alpha/beta hydrolase [Gorillibacterium sp.]|nr:alpha/beta hydrolase [Gorillibacterium sp.]